MKTFAKSVGRIVPLVVAVAGLARCGPGSSTSHPPSIRDLTVSSTAVVDGTTGRAEVLGSLAFSDSGGDVASLSFSSDAGTATIPTPGAAGIVDGRGSAAVTLSPGRYGTFPFQVWVTDGAGAQSNRLSGTVTLLPEDGGFRWTRVSTLPVAAVASAPGGGHARYVAVGDGGLILTSTDGLAWTGQPSPVTVNLRGVAWSGARFVAVGDDATVLRSDDGYVWTSTSDPIAGMVLHDVGWGGGAFVAVGGVPGSDPAPLLLLASTDGVSWTPGTAARESFHGPLLRVAWGNGRWVALGRTHWYSDDGLAWFEATGDSFTWGTGIGWNGAQFVSSGYRMAFSADGIAWTPAQVDLLPTGYSMGGVAWSGFRWLAIGIQDAETSTDGNVWTDTPLYPTPFVQKEIRLLWDGDRFPGRFLASGGGIWTSP